MRLIINADDLGYSVATNDTIFSLMNAGKVTSATLMANGEAFQDAVSRIADFPGHSFGVHLNLTEGQPLTLCPRFLHSGIVDEKGYFTAKLPRTGLNLHIMKAVEKEWAEQIAKLLDHGISISHLDSHHHTHTIPWLFLPLKKIQKRFRIRKVRLSMDFFYIREYSISKKKLLGKKAWNTSLKHIYKTTTSDHFTSLDWFIKGLRDGKGPSRGAVELMCHPGQLWASEETKLLWTDWAQDLSLKGKLISYNDL